MKKYTYFFVVLFEVVGVFNSFGMPNPPIFQTSAIPIKETIYIELKWSVLMDDTSAIKFTKFIESNGKVYFQLGHINFDEIKKLKSFSLNKGKVDKEIIYNYSIREKVDTLYQNSTTFKLKNLNIISESTILDYINYLHIYDRLKSEYDTSKPINHLNIIEQSSINKRKAGKLNTNYSYFLYEIYYDDKLIEFNIYNGISNSFNGLTLSKVYTVKLSEKEKLKFYENINKLLISDLTACDSYSDNIFIELNNSKYEKIIITTEECLARRKNNSSIFNLYYFIVSKRQKTKLD